MGLPAPILSKGRPPRRGGLREPAPAALFGDDEFCRRAGWASLLLFIDLNGGQWSPDPPDVDQAEAAMLAVAAGEVAEAWFAGWLRERVTFPGGQQPG